MAVERERRFEPQRVACAESGRDEAERPARREERLPERDDAVGGDVELEAVGAGVARSRDDRVLAGDTALGEAKAPQRREREIRHAREDVLRERALQGEQTDAVAPVLDADRRRVAGVSGDPREVLLDVRRVHAEEEGVLGEAVNRDVVDRAAGLVAQAAVADGADRERCDGAGDEPLGRGDRSRPGEMDLAHVRDVEDPRALADGRVLGEDRRVLHGHQEAAELDHPRAERAVRRGERCLAQRRQRPIRRRYACTVL